MIGLFIGSFNPPTLAHLAICLKLKRFFTRIVFVPVNSKDKNLVSFKKRCTMLNIYQRKYPFLAIDHIMENYSYFDYRILNLLKKKYKNIKIIIGSDILTNLKKFDEYEYILNNYEFIVIKRNGMDIPKYINDHFDGYQKHFKELNYTFDCSSSMVRELIKNKKETSDYLDKDIENYIVKERLYF